MSNAHAKEDSALKEAARLTDHQIRELMESTYEVILPHGMSWASAKTQSELLSYRDLLEVEVQAKLPTMFVMDERSFIFNPSQEQMVILSGLGLNFRKLSPDQAFPISFWAFSPSRHKGVRIDFGQEVIQ